MWRVGECRKAAQRLESPGLKAARLLGSGEFHCYTPVSSTSVIVTFGTTFNQALAADAETA